LGLLPLCRAGRLSPSLAGNLVSHI
jgi:hypothetical protein